MRNVICENDFCTGCAACANACTQNAITICKNDKGFDYPKIQEELCVNCDVCRKICPQHKDVAYNDVGIIYAAVSKDDFIRSKSSSGGVFTCIAQYVLKNKGVVFGAALSNDMRVYHTYVSSAEQLELLRGSKYVQSEVGYSYRQVKELLNRGTQVLFTGTPCQVSALKAFLKIDYDNLLTIDILCHGVPSPLVFKKFIDYKNENENEKTISNITFRNKYPGWQSYSTKLNYSDGTVELDNSYVRLFLKDLCLRESCYNCRYATERRIGDITLGDFWAYKESAPEHIENDDLGISLVSVNSIKGRKVFSKIKSKVSTADRTIEAAKVGNPILSHPSSKGANYDEFWEDIKCLGWSDIMAKYHINPEPQKDCMSKEDRSYYAQPYSKRHRRHKIHCWKLKILKIIRGK